MAVVHRIDLSLMTVASVIAGLLVVVVAQAGPVWAATTNPTPSAGTHKSATTLPFAVSGTSQLSVDVGTGNALFTDRLVTLPGVTADVPLSLWYDSSVWSTTTAPWSRRVALG